MKLAIIFNKEREGTIGCYFERAAKRLGIPFDHYWTKDGEAIPKGYALYLRIDHGDYKYDIPDGLRPSAFFVVDTHLEKPYQRIKEQALHYDYVFCAQKNGADRLKRDTGANAVWIPIGCDPEKHRDLGLERRFDVAFVGTEGKKNLRGELLKALAHRYPNSFIGRAESGLLSNIYSSAKIGFNYSINGDINMRMFEVLSCGALLVTNLIRDNGFEEIFSAGVNVAVYRNPGELFKVIDHYLACDDERKMIAGQGHALAVSSHTYADRLKKMLEISGWK
ncbi:MAG: glycosyltransferase [Candidatus Omnitrophota bacterium]|nr:glycosyltransferase [Candidatus Omnitrophota bacterium]